VAERVHLADYGVQVDFGVEEPAALELNAPFFFAAANPARPWVTLQAGALQRREDE